MNTVRDKTEIREARTAEDFRIGRELFEEYQEDIGVDLCFQGFADELERIESIYSPPVGALLIARRDGRPIGCVGVRRLDERVCEMKRLYVRPAARGTGLGRDLAMAILERARALGYRDMRLDTMESMETARGLYESLGFEIAGPYRGEPHPELRYMTSPLDTNDE